MSNEKSQFGQIGAGDDIKSGHAKYDAGKPELFQGVFDYFPRALMEVANVSGYGAKKYSWGGAKGVKGAYERYSNAMGRHIMLAGIDGPYDIGPGGSGLLHDAQVAWNALFKLEVGLRDGRYTSTRGFPLPDKVEEKQAEVLDTPVDRILGGRPEAGFKAFSDFEEQKDVKGLVNDADVLKRVREALGPDTLVITDPREWYALTGSWPEGVVKTGADENWIAEYDFYAGSQFELTPKAKKAIGISKVKSRSSVRKAAAKAVPVKRKAAAPKPVRKR